MDAYDAGDPIRLLGTFTNVGGTLTAPTSVYLHIVPPNQGGQILGTVEYTLAQGSIQQAAAGSYYYDINPLPSGTWGVWTYVYVGTGALNAAFTGQFFVRQGAG